MFRNQTFFVEGVLIRFKVRGVRWVKTWDKEGFLNEFYSFNVRQVDQFCLLNAKLAAIR